MSGRQDKKIRQLYRRDVKDEMKKRVDEMMPKLKKMVKPAPSHFPNKLWYKLAGVFLNLD